MLFQRTGLWFMVLPRHPFHALEPFLGSRNHEILDLGNGGIVGDSGQNELTRPTTLIPIAVVDEVHIEKHEACFSQRSFDLGLQPALPHVATLQLNGVLYAGEAIREYSHDLVMLVFRIRFRESR